MSRQDAPTTMAQLKRRVQRLEAQLAAMQDFFVGDRERECLIIRRNADLAARVDQALQILRGEN